MRVANGTIHADALCNVIGIYDRELSVYEANLTLKLELVAVRKRQPASWRGVVCVCIYGRRDVFSKCDVCSSAAAALSLRVVVLSSS